VSRTALRRPRPSRSQAYQQLLRDPRWQKKRLEIFARDHWTCQECRATTKELQVHHKWYVAGALPWAVPRQALVTLCVTCHGKKRPRRRREERRGGTGV
jgi:5-methylcytosine-specific restriction endonuclease McrA